MNILDKRIINLNSKHALQNNATYLSDVLFKFKEILREEEDIIYTTCGLLNAQIPVSFYNVNVNNQTLYYKVDGIPYTLVIPESNYNSTSFIPVLKAQFALGAHGRTLSITQNRLNGKFTITVSGYTLNILASPLNKVLGLNFLNSYTITGSYTCIYPCNFLGVKKIKVYSSALAGFSYDSYVLGGSTIINTIAVNDAPFGLISFNAQMDSSLRIKQKIINEIDIQLRDEDDALIDFNGIDWTITLQINIYRVLKLSTSSFDIKKSPAIETIGKTSMNVINDEENNIENADMDDLDLLSIGAKRPL